jgi:hypothetical protein
MKISELIEQLNRIKTEDGDVDVVLSVTDHTDWTYNFEFPGFGIDTVYGVDSEIESEDENGDEILYCVCSVSI